MAFWWSAETQPGFQLSDAELDALGIGTQFDDQLDAEQWLTDSYPELLDAGLASVSLYEADRLVYGPMGLEAD